MGVLSDGLEIEIINDGNSPHADYLELANLALSNLPSILKEGEIYLHRFAKISLEIEPQAVVFGSGLNVDSSHKQVQVFYCDIDDLYGLWCVGFVYQPALGKFTPIQFGRLQQ